MEILSCSNLIKTYQKQNVVNGLGFSVSQGEAFALLGSNGAGKTTTIKMILDLIKKDGGVIELMPDITVGYSPETPYFHSFLTGKEVLEFYGGLQKIPWQKLRNQIPLLMNQAGLEDGKTKVKNYSKGMLQRLALAQVLLGDPQLLILDEPTAGLDALGRVEMMHTIQKLKESGKTIIINSHILNDIERVCERGIIIKKGELIYEWEKKNEDRSLEEIFVEKIGGTEKWES